MELCGCGGEVIRCVSRIDGAVYACTKCYKLIETVSDRLKREAKEVSDEKLD